MQKRSSKTIYIVSYALKVSVNGVTCVLVIVAISGYQTYFDVFNIHVSTKTCVTSNNLILHKALTVTLDQQ